MSIVTYLNNCKPINKTNHDLASVPAVYLFLAFLSPIAFVISSLALTVLTRAHAIRLGSMRINLITLTIFEALLNLMIFILMVIAIIQMTYMPDNLILFITYLICFPIINGALCSRNWTITLIALARCVAIVRPIETHQISSHLFRPKWMACCTLICIFIGFFLSFIRLGELEICLCTNLNNTWMVTVNDEWKLGKELFFTYQSALPICIVLITTTLLMVTLCKHKQPNLNVVQKTKYHPHVYNNKHKSAYCDDSNQNEEIFFCSNNNNSLLQISKPIRNTNNLEIMSNQVQLKHRINVNRSLNQAKATRMIALITIVFILFEAPIFFCIILESRFDKKSFDLVTNALKSLVVLDSCANVIIYVIMSKRFKQESWRLWASFKKRTFIF